MSKTELFSTTVQAQPHLLLRFSNNVDGDIRIGKVMLHSYPVLYAFRSFAIGYDDRGRSDLTTNCNWKQS